MKRALRRFTLVGKSLFRAVTGLGRIARRIARPPVLSRLGIVSLALLALGGVGLGVAGGALTAQSLGAAAVTLVGLAVATLQWLRPRQPRLPAPPPEQRTGVPAPPAEPPPQPTALWGTDEPEAARTPSVEPVRTLTDWGPAPAPAAFFGRHEEVATLTDWIRGRARLGVIVARGGMGKTTLAARVARDSRDLFDVVVWRSLADRQSPEELLRDLVGVLLPARAPEAVSEGVTDRLIAEFIRVLRARRCLVVLDNMESVLPPGTSMPSPQERAHLRLLHALADAEHDGTVLITTREAPAELLDRPGRQVCTLQLGGLDTAACAELLTVREIHADAAAAARMAEVYSGNPWEMTLAIGVVHDLYGGDAGAFLREEVAVTGDVRGLLAGQIARLNPLALAVLRWLSLGREPLGLDDLIHCLTPSVIAKSRVLDAMGTLLTRALAVRTDPGRFTVIPVIAEYMIEDLLDLAFSELVAGEPQVLSLHGLLRSSFREYVQQAQRRVLLAPLAARLLDVYGPDGSRELLRSFVRGLRDRPEAANGYAAANALHLALAIGADLSSFDFSGLTIRHAALQSARLSHVSFRGTRFVGTSFADTFGIVNAVAGAPGGELAAAGTAGGDVRLWRMSDSQPVAVWREHMNAVTAVAFSPDGRWLASASVDQTIRVWELRTGRAVRVLRGHEHIVADVAWHPSRPLLATAGYDNRVRVWHALTGDPIRILTDHTNWVRAVRFADDGTLLVSASLDGTVRLWDTDDWRCLRILGGDEAYWNVAVSAELVAAGNPDGDIRIWKRATGVPRDLGLGHSDRVRSLAFTPAGERLLSSGDDSLVRVWDMTTGRLLRRLEGHQRTVNSVALLGAGPLAVSGGGDQSLRIWDIDTGACQTSLEGQEQPINSVACSPAGIIATGGMDTLIRLWDRDGHCLRILAGHAAKVGPLAFNGDGTWLASCGDDRTVRVWDVATGRAIRVLTGHRGYVSDLAFSPDGQRLASGGQHQLVHIWDLTTGNILFSVPAVESAAGPVTYTPDGRLLITGGGDHYDPVKLWDARDGTPVATLRGGTPGGVIALAVTPDGGRLFAAVAQGPVEVWDLGERRLLARLHGHEGYWRAVACHPDGRTVATGGDDRLIRVWRVEDLSDPMVIVGHSGPVQALAYTPDGMALASASLDGTARLWDEGGRQVSMLVPDRPYEEMDITGAHGLTDAQRGTLRALGAVDEAVRSQR
ncbi:AAA family ATPase [Microbispora sp. NEAU-D428]|uniref:WD40 domain-containing protein n=1 Tax=Microbispora sitophila TaxID=2771537 RepID=UPI0018687E7A|nr:NB-ARC domain-containing protein [Microbispora sitophila]MBE3012822.1 AAA family ATPase [Microbispora sitophila]